MSSRILIDGFEIEVSDEISAELGLKCGDVLSAEDVKGIIDLHLQKTIAASDAILGAEYLGEEPEKNENPARRCERCQGFLNEDELIENARYCRRCRIRQHDC